MSNDNSTVSDDLSLDLEDDDTNDFSADEAERSDESDDSDDAGTDLDLESDNDQDDKAKKREAATEQHARSWAAKIVAGKASYKDVPVSLQYCIPRIKALLGEKEEKIEEKKSTSSRSELMAIVRFETLKDKVQKANRTKEQSKILNAEFRLLLDKGFEPDIALKRAIKEANVNLEPEAEMPKIRTGGAPVKSKNKFDGTEDPNTMSRQELADFNASHPR